MSAAWPTRRGSPSFFVVVAGRSMVINPISSSGGIYKYTYVTPRFLFAIQHVTVAGSIRLLVLGSPCLLNVAARR